MAFFGATSQPSLFGASNTGTTSSGFGGFGTGTQGGFGANTGSGLGTFGSGTTSNTGASTGGFGGATGGFGAATTSAPSIFGGFGTSSSPFSFSTPTTSTTTGFGGFGSATGGFGLGSTGTAGFGGFGNAGTGTGFGATGTSTFGTSVAPGFGTTSTFGTSAPSAFGTSGTSGFGGTGQSLFGAGQTGLGAANAFGGGSGLFGMPSGSLFGATGQPQTALQQEEANLANIAMAVSLPQIYGDERDAIIAKYNQLQAYWGTGKGYYSQTGFVEFKPDNPFCRFKALGYHLIPKGNNELGQVTLVFGKREEDVTVAQQQIVDTLQKILGSKPTLSVCVEGIRPLPDDKTEVVIYVLERPPTGPAKRVTATDLFNFLNQPQQKGQISSQLNVESMLPKVGWTDEQLREYLDKPPAGIDPLLWQQAKLDNPDPEKYIPVPMIGFKELQRRLKHQAEQTKLYQQRLDVMASDLADLQTQHSTMLSKLEDYKRRELELGHRLLKVIVKQEIYRKMGYAIQVEEETLRAQLEQLQVELNHPTQFKGRLNELMSQMRMQLQMASVRIEPTFQIDPETQADIKTFLKQQHIGVQHLIEIIKEDQSDAQVMEQGISKSSSR